MFIIEWMCVLASGFCNFDQIDLKQVIQFLGNTFSSTSLIFYWRFFLDYSRPFYVRRIYLFWQMSLQWRHTERDGISNRRGLDCLLNRLFGRRSKKHQSSASLAFVRGNHRWPLNSPHKGPVTRIMFPFDDVIMAIYKMAVNKLIRNSHGIWVHWKCSVLLVIEYVHIMMTSSNGNIFCVAGPLPGEFTGHRWILSQRPVARSFGVFFDLRVK